TPWLLSQSALPFDLMLDASPAASGLELSLSFVHDRFEAASAARMLDDYLGLLAQLDRDVRVGELRLPSTAALAAPSFVPHACRSVYARFAEQAAERPDAIALTFEGRSWSYAQLYAWSSRISARLRAAGVQRQDRVAVCLDRSADVVAAILGVLGAGA